MIFWLVVLIPVLAWCALAPAIQIGFNRNYCVGCCGCGGVCACSSTADIDQPIVDLDPTALLLPLLQFALGFGKWNSALLHDYSKVTALAECHRSKDLCFVRGKYLVELAETKGGRFPSRQQLEKENKNATLLPCPSWRHF